MRRDLQTADTLRRRQREILHFLVEDRRQGEAEFLGVLVVLEINVPGEVRRARADGDLDGLSWHALR